MTDRDGPTIPVDVIEIELTGDGPLAPSEPASGDGREPRLPPNWRRLVGIATTVGAALGIGGGLLLRSLDESPESTVTTTLPDDLASLITTPPTLADLDTLPPPDFTEPPDDSPQPTTSQDRALFDGSITPPTYPPNDDIALVDVVTFRIEPAIEALAEDVARRSHTRVELGIEGFVLDVTIERDPALDRYQLVFEQAGLTQVAIVDNATGATYVNPGTENLVTILNEELIAGSGAADVNEFFDRLLLGPLRPDTFSVTSTSGRSMYDLDGVGPARQFVTQIDGSRAPEWQIYTFTPVPEFRPEDRPPTLDYFAYVDERGEIVQVDGVALIGDVPQSVQHRIERLDDEHRVELPEPLTPVTAAPAATSVPGPTAPGTTVADG